MPDYKEMYLTLVRATEKMNCILIEAQQTCENLYIENPEAVVQILPLSTEKNGTEGP